MLNIFKWSTSTIELNSLTQPRVRNTFLQFLEAFSHSCQMLSEQEGK